MGSVDRFEALYRTHCGAVRAFVHRRTAAASADDVVSEVFVAAWRRLDELPRDELPWLLGIARGLLANQRRADARRLALNDRLTAYAAPAAEPAAERQADDSEILHALRALRPADQEVLLLVAWDGLERAQAARVLGISATAFSVRLHRARRRLQRAVGSQSARQPADTASAMEVW